MKLVNYGLFISFVLLSVRSTFSQTTIQLDLKVPQDSVFEVNVGSPPSLIDGIPVVLSANYFQISGGSLPYSYSWTQNNTAVETGQSFSFTPQQGAGYSFLVSDARNCTVEVLLRENQTFINSSYMSAVNVFPTFVDDYLMVELGKNFIPATVEIFDVNAVRHYEETLYESSKLSLNLPSGIYIINIHHEDLRYSRKIIFQ